MDLPSARWLEVLCPHLEKDNEAVKRNWVPQTNYSERWKIGASIAANYHIGVSWGLHETTVGRIVRKVEDLPISPSSQDVIAIGEGDFAYA